MLTLRLPPLLAAADYRCSLRVGSGIFAALMNVSALFHSMADVWEIMCVHVCMLSVHCFLLIDMVGGGMTV